MSKGFFLKLRNVLKISMPVFWTSNLPTCILQRNLAVTGHAHLSTIGNFIRFALGVHPRCNASSRDVQGIFPKRLSGWSFESGPYEFVVCVDAKGENISDFVLDEDLGGFSAWDVATFADNKILLAGRDRSTGLTGLKGLIRLNADGTFDQQFERMVVVVGVVPQRQDRAAKWNRTADGETTRTMPGGSLIRRGTIP